MNEAVAIAAVAESEANNKTILDKCKATEEASSKLFGVFKDMIAIARKESGLDESLAAFKKEEKQEPKETKS